MYNQANSADAKGRAADQQRWVSMKVGATNNGIEVVLLK